MSRQFLLALPLLLLAAACGGGSTEGGPRLVVLYAPCSVNKDFLAPYDGAVPFTPNLAAFAAEGTVFERHNNEAGQSGCDFAAIFSGVQADRHGVFCHPKALDTGLFQISEAFALEGWDTHFWSGQQMGAFELGYGQGVPKNQAYTHKYADRDAYTATDARFEAILDRLADDDDYRAFVQVNFTVTHNPYHKGITNELVEGFLAAYPQHASGLTPEELQRYLAIYDENRLPLQWDYEERAQALGFTPEDREKLARTLEFFYKVRVYELDQCFGKLVALVRERELLDDSLIAVTADHGEILYRDNALFQWTHGNQLAPEVLHVPWIVRGPAAGVPAGRYGGVTRSIDVFPTLCGLADVEVGRSMPVDGVDLAAAVRGDEPPPALRAFSHTTTIDKRYDKVHVDTLLRDLNPADDPTVIWVRVRDGDLIVKHRYLGPVEGFTEEAFDHAADPGERTNLFDQDNPLHAELDGELKAYKKRLLDGYFQNNATALSRSEADARLRALGYIGEGDSGTDG